MKIKELRALRLQKRLTQAEVAKKLKVSQAYYSLIELGRRPDDVARAATAINSMRARASRTGGGKLRAGRSA